MWKLLLGSWVGEQCRVCRLNIASAEVDSKLKQNTSCSFNGMYEHAQLDTAVCFVPELQGKLSKLILTALSFLMVQAVLLLCTCTAE